MSSSQNVATRAVRSTVYVALNTYVSVAVTFVSSILLARLLEPAHFGIVALANFFLALFGRVRELGLNQALVHRQKNLEEAYAVHFILHMGLAFLNLLLVLVAAPLLANRYPDQPQMVSVLIVFAVFVIFQAASQTQQIAFEKELLFRYTTLINIFALVVSSIISVAMAYKNYGVWSLVAGNTANTFLVFVGLWFFRPWKLQFKFDKEIAKWFLRFGFYLWIGAIVTFILFQYNDFIVGTLLGAATLGFYTKALKFAELPNSLVTSVISRVALPTYAKLQNEKQKLQVSFNLVLTNIVRLSLPLTLVLFFTAREFTLVLIGEKWLPMVPIFKLLILYSFLRAIFDDAGAFLTAVGKPQIVSKYISLQAVVLLALSPLAVKFLNVDGAALALDAVMLLGVALAYFYVSRRIHLQFKLIFLPSLVSAVAATLFYLWISNWYNFATLTPLISLVMKGVVVGGVYLAVVLLIEGKKIREDAVYFLRSVRG
jgi:PST family polysaccharide transporter